MALWIILTILMVVTLFWVMYPVLWSARDVIEDQAFESAVYRDQLQELERDAERGVINEKEKISALNEVSRRLLGVKAKYKNSSASSSPTRSTNVVILMSVVAITAFTGLVYKSLGNPGLPAQPQAARLESATKSGDMDAMILQVQQYLRKNPKDLKGWQVLAPALKRAERYSQAGDAYAKIMQLGKPTPAILTDYAESVMLGNQGLPNEQVRKALKAALAMDNNYTKARFYWAMALQRDGFGEQAIKQWQILRDQNLDNEELKISAQRQIDALKAAGKVPENDAAKSAKIPALDKDQRQNAAAMTAEQRQAMITSMVERLAGRLKENGDDLDGWQRLIRARMVLGQKEAATVALETARGNFKNNDKALASLEQLSRDLGL